MDADEAYHSGLTLPTDAGEDFKKNVAVDEVPGSVVENEGSGVNPMAGTPPKDRAMTKLFSGKPAVDKSDSSDPGPAGGGIKPSISGSKTKLGTPVAMTPLAGRFQSISFQPQKLDSGLASYSPTSDYSSGNFPSLADSGFSSMPSMPSMERPGENALAPPTSTESRMEVDTGLTSQQPQSIPEVNIQRVDSTPSSTEVTMDTSQVPPPVTSTGSANKSPSEAGSFGSRESSSLSPATGPFSMLVAPVPSASSPARRSESPGAVPMVGEDVEIETDPRPTAVGDQRRGSAGSSGSGSGSSGQRHEGAKRSAMDSDLGPTTKNPRLSPEVMSGKEFSPGPSLYCEWDSQMWDQTR